MDRRSVDEKMAPHDFVADFVWAGREVLRKPSVAVVSVLLWSGSGTMSGLMHVQAADKHPLALVVTAIVGMAIAVFGLGWLGAERTFFRLRLEGKEVTLRELFGAAPGFIGRFFALSLLAALVAVPAMGISLGLAVWAAASHSALLATALAGVVVILVMVVGDFLFTFVTPALVFTTPSATEAIGIGFRMIRKTWPRSALYVLCPPLALNLLNTMYPIRLPLVTLVTSAAFAVLALVAKGATAAFYLRERPVAVMDPDAAALARAE